MLQQNKRHIIIAAISQVGILALVMFWVWNSYVNEKAALQREATFTFDQNRSNLDRERWQTALSDAFVEREVDIKFPKKGDTTINLGRIVIKDRLTDSLRKLQKLRKDRDTLDNAMVRIYKTGKDSTETIFLTSVVDSTFLSRLQERLALAIEEDNLQYSLNPIELEGATLKENGFYTTRHEGRRGERQKMVAEITGYQPFLFQKILPEALLSLLMLLLSGLAFWLANKTLKKQKMVADQQRNFMYNMTHELKTPVTTIGLALESLKNERLPETSKQSYLELSTESVGRLNVLIDRVLGSAKLENGKLELKKEPINVCSILNDLVQEHNFILHENNSDLEVKSRVNGSECITMADQYHIRNAINNLIDNALKYSGDSAEVTVSMRESSKYAAIEVRDTGVGVPKKELPFLFDKFYRANDGKQHNVKGFGLGLHYAKQIAELHGGSLEASSELGKGSAFTFKLPKHG